ncbi:bifunctional 3-demethylubiquinone-9 3-methyltransferase/ 2-octaprenyl-6-hydroxy phenol methylase [Bacteroidales bacterium Barb6]|nr:bifunctional 3-demethylubiquinone-9 3-methyltransferase/ 2-octaprenyl-6-hydroxy phenol methylase [Bacteroidales bacterium Barb6]
MSFEYTGTDLLELMQKAVNYNAFLASLILKQQVPTSGKILDIGAGIGLFAGTIRENGYNVHCLEPDLFQANLLKGSRFEVSTNINELADGSFDFIYALNVLEHIENDREELLLWAKKLKKGGKLLIYVPAFHLLYSSMDKKVGHFRRYRKKDLTEKIIHAGLVPVCNAKYADSLGFFVTLLYKLINKSDGDVNENSLIFYDRVLFPLSRLGDFFFNRLFGKNVFIIAEKLVNH